MSVTNKNRLFLAFRTTLQDDAWINKVVAWLTSKRGEKAPAGILCHVELIVETEREVFHRFSIYKKTLAAGAPGEKPRFVQGSVHAIPIDKFALAHYTLLPVTVPNRQAMLHFIDKQFNGGFHHVAYWFGWLGIPFRISRYHPLFLQNKERWTCVSFCIAALQAGKYPPVMRMSATGHTPNSLFRHLRHKGLQMVPMRVAGLRLGL